MIIAQISDTHIAFDTDDAKRRVRDFEWVIADINALDPAPDAIVHTGDIVHNGRADEYREAVRILDAARAPVYVMPGNKDEREALRAAFGDRGYIPPGSGFIQYAVEDFALRLIMLDTLKPGDNKGDFCAGRADQLARLLDVDASRPVAVFTHHPPFEVMVGPDRIHFACLDAMAELRKGLLRSEKVIGVFSGHVHRAAFGSIGGIPASVVQCVATPLRKGTYSAGMTMRPVYHLHRLDPEWGSITETRIVDPSQSGA